MQRKTWVHYAFVVSLVVTGIFGVLEIVSGASVYFTSMEKIISWLDSTLLEDILRHPTSPVSRYVTQVLTTFTVSVSAKSLTVAWLFIHGITNTAIAYFALREKLWIYPIAVVIFSTLGLYQVYLYIIGPTIPLLILALFGVLVAALTSIEYYTRRHQ